MMRTTSRSQLPGRSRSACGPCWPPIDFEMAVAAADMAETDKLAATVAKWWTEIKVFVRTQVTNARTESANTGIKQIKRTGR
ncbi:MAG: transposase, partial [Cutibacterium acnes]